MSRDVEPNKDTPLTYFLRKTGKTGEKRRNSPAHVGIQTHNLQNARQVLEPFCHNHYPSLNSLIALFKWSNFWLLLLLRIHPQKSFSSTQPESEPESEFEFEWWPTWHVITYLIGISLMGFLSLALRPDRDAKHDRKKNERSSNFRLPSKF